MSNLILRAFAPAMCLFLLGSAAQAGCREDPRSVNFGEGNVVKLKSYLCAPDGNANNYQIKVEFFQLSDNATSLVLAKSSSKFLKKTIGSPKLVENEVAKIYADLLKRFGTLRSLTGPYAGAQTSFHVGARSPLDMDMQDTLGSKSVRVLTDASNRELPYPAYDEIISLRQKRIPSGMKVYYSVQCADDPSKPVTDECENFEKNTVAMNLWRGMSSADVKNFAKNLAAYNRLVGSKSVLAQFVKKVSSEFEMLNYVAGGNWPEDFIILMGSSSQDGCIESSNWLFNYMMRNIVTDMVTIENVSPRPVTIDGLIGARSAETKLRAAVAPTASNGGALGAMKEQLAPRQKLLIPLKIAFVSAPQTVSGTKFDHPNTARQLYEELGTSGYAGNTPFGAPAFKDYIYGPELSLTGVMVDGKQVALTPADSNDLNLTISSGSGSCPYLLSWDEEARDWADHGKVLHKGKGKELEYSETGKFEGFRPRFRLEEREPEIAYIDQAELAISLRNGEALVLKPDNNHLAARDGDYAKLYWGDGIEFSFALPEAVAVEDVVESRLTLTGYYERYSSLMAAVNFSRPAGLKLTPLIAAEVRKTP
ncbi:MAG TPA: hypothetical protein VN919_04435 [Xanthobacteraceae bacterium]|nr:hypothetical protein [Xanthobacteraceae bacterium]